MNKLSKNEKGIGTIEIILVIVIVGIIGFGGWYAWKNKNKLNTASVPTISSTTPSKSTTNPIIEAVKKDCESTSGSTASQITVNKQEGNYAVASVVCSNPQIGKPTSRVYLKQSSGTWTVVLHGDGAPTTSADLQPYGFPSDFLN